MIKFATLLIALTLVNQSPAQDITAEIQTSKTSIQIAEPFDVIVLVTAPAGTQISFPPITESFGEFEVIAHDDQFDIPVSTPSANNAQMRSWTRRMQLETLVTGELVIPSLEIQTNASASKFKQIRTEEKQIRVISVLENQADPFKIRDLKKEIDVSVSDPVSYAWIGWALGGLGGLVALGLLIGKLATRKKWLTAKQWAMDEFESIRQSENLRTSDTKTVFAKTETTIKTYLESCFGFPATKQSTDELLSSIEPLTSSENTSRLSTLLNNSEMAKYAGREFDEAELRQSIDEAAELIEAIERDVLEAADRESTESQTRETV